jgi:peptidoglycan/xylan/chitin deacetylase (PgdA/CDA1 family)
MSEPQPTGPRQAVPILTYHSLDDSGAVASVAPREFREHMRILAQRGFSGITLSTLLDSWGGRGTLPPRPVVITFDDGFANLLKHAAPLLSDLGFRGTIFVVSGRCGQTNDWSDQTSCIPRLPLLSWSELGQMAGAGFEVGAHTVTHPRLTELSPSDATKEIVESKAAIEDRLGQPVKSFAYPFGIFARTHYEVVREHFQAACSAELGKALPESDRHQLPRLDIYYLRHPVLFQFFETAPGQLYLKVRGLGRRMRGGK